MSGEIRKTVEGSQDIRSKKLDEGIAEITINRPKVDNVFVEKRKLDSSRFPWRP